MVQTRESFVVTRPARLVLGLTIALGLGAAVAASPIRSVTDRSVPTTAPVTKVAASTTFQALGDGPAIAVQKSFGRNDEDCVTVTQVKGADGRIYASRGMVCR